MNITNKSLKIVLILASGIGYAIDSYILNKYGVDVMADIRLIWVCVAYLSLFLEVEN